MTEHGPMLRAYPLPGSWMRKAACANADPNVFYTRSGHHNDAREICARCPVAAECLDYALACEDLDPYGGHGVWAGLSGRERNDIRKQMRNTA